MDVDLNEDKIVTIKDILKKPIIKENRDNFIKESIQDKITENKFTTKAKKLQCFQCKICPYNTFRKPFLDKHMQQKHGFSKVKSEEKDEIANNVLGNITEKMQYEESNDYDGTDFKCNLCNFKTSYLNLLNLHQDVHEIKEMEVYQCTQCNFQTEEVTALQGHEKTHKKLVLLSCQQCDYATRLKCNLKAHMKIHENPEKLKRFHCATCKNFVSFHYSALARHIRIKHGSNDKVFKRDKCPFTGKIQKQVTKHCEIVHSGCEEMPTFKCDKCDFVTHNEQTIQKHVQRHKEREKDGEEIIVMEKNEEKDIIWFCCNRCNFRSKDQRYVILHKKVHMRVDEINKIGENLVQYVEAKIENGQGDS